MPAATFPLALTGQPPVRRLKLTMPPLDGQQSEPQGSEPEQLLPAKEERSTTPRRPSFSPVTPTISHTSLVSADQSVRPTPEWIDEPEPLPVSLEDNPDAIALRSAISILQMQRQQSLQDIKILDKMKAAALREPEKFVEDLKAGRLQKPDPVGIITMDDSDDDMTENPPKGIDGIDTASAAAPDQFGKFPNPQSVVRSPAINWDKYHVVGESLDKLHEQQRKRPGSNYMAEDHGRQQPENVIAAPYRPFIDKLESSPGTPTQQSGTR
jgi:hypothetical protein